MSGEINYIEDGLCFVTEFVSDTHSVFKKYGCLSREILNLCGGVPGKHIPAIDLKIISVLCNAIDVVVENKIYYLQRTIDFSMGVISNNVMYIHEKGNHIGLSLFLNHVKQARLMGFKELNIFAAGDPSQKEWDGYYFWARVGYMMTDRNDIEDANEVVARFQPGISVGQMVRTDEGYKFWKQNGFSWNGRFMLKDKSENIRHLQKYLQIKGIDFIL